MHMASASRVPSGTPLGSPSRMNSASAQKSDESSNESIEVNNSSKLNDLMYKKEDVESKLVDVNNRIAKLESTKNKAIEEEDFMKAKNCKAQIQKLEEAKTRLSDMSRRINEILQTINKKREEKVTTQMMEQKAKRATRHLQHVVLPGSPSIGPKQDSKPDLAPFSGKSSAEETMDTEEENDSTLIGSQTELVIALYDYDAEGATELSFKEGDIIEMLRVDEGTGWMKGVLHKTDGWFPISYVEKYNPRAAERNIGETPKKQIFRMSKIQTESFNLNIFFEDLNKSKAFVFEPYASVLDVIKTIQKALTADPHFEQDRRENKIKPQFKDYGLYLNTGDDGNSPSGIWLEEDKTLWLYALDSKSKLVFKQKMANKPEGESLCLKILVLSNEVNYKIIRVDPSASVGAVIDILNNLINGGIVANNDLHKYALFLPGKNVPLQESSPLSAYNLQELSQLEFKRKPMYEFSRTGQTDTLNLPSNATVGNAVEHLLKYFKVQTSGKPGSWGLRKQMRTNDQNQTSVKNYWLMDHNELNLYNLSKGDLLDLCPRDKPEHTLSPSEIIRLEVKWIPAQDAMMSRGQQPKGIYQITPGMIPLFKGESIVVRISNVKMVEIASVKEGELIITNYKIAFKKYQRSTVDAEVPLLCISQMDKSKLPSNQETADIYALTLQSKDFRKFRFELSAENLEKLFEWLQSFVFPPSENSFFAFFNQEGFPARGGREGFSGSKGASIYNIEEEMKRFGIADVNSGWRLCDLNDDFMLSPTYPRRLIVPSDISNQHLKNVFKFRSKGRIPAMVWKRKDSAAVICRSSQPLVGLSNARCAEDEELLKQVGKLGSSNQRVHIIDARPLKNAMGNKAKGAGYESDSNYPNCKVEFLAVENIHHMRDSVSKLYALCQPSFESDLKWYSQLEQTKWLEHLRAIMCGVSRVVELIEKSKVSVLIHCSDGWDRTAQISALSQLLLDPFYRTIRGLEILIEKEFVSFGHRFTDRLGHGKNLAEHDNNHETSPVFLQFVDCVWQLSQQYPFEFEWNDDLLVQIMDDAYSCRFGTFIFNCEDERTQAGVTHSAISFWSFVHANLRKFTNPLFKSGAVSASQIGSSGVLFPSTAMKNFQLWRGYYLRWNRQMRLHSTASVTKEMTSELEKRNAKIKELEAELDKFR
eukprot:TRINITY_DN3384_c0_g1_i1.p1 TRINITY_DN3384_c0_g1~~TRINITY_DN3384_c0_g1_i1.p1  ORF type:complete len:1157 (-),score=311.11 TRINITY_DN3384_c0_g1_i1:12-3482(-)